ncbi:amino acid adenylation domain-containing protein [Kitasatospora sp. NPDC057223]|uniref:non-ribosomal peptide synthetase n=1 Tax=Kitasatospora sp. NPDC057223 TaxID=3346055 RepID=UPI003644920C
MTAEPFGAGPLPLAPAQETMWLAERLAPGHPTYNVPVSWVLRGTLDVDALRGALAGIVARHAPLRTRFEEHDGEPVQATEASVSVPLSVVDVPDLTAARAAAHALAQQPFALDTAPLWRVAVYRSGPTEHLLVVVVHHLVCDGWSVDVITRELAAGYAAGAGLPAGEPPRLEVQYPDYVRWQRQRLTDERIRELGEWWRGKLAGAPPSELLTDRPRPSRRDPAGATTWRLLADPTQEDLRALATGLSGTPYVVLLAAFLATVSYWTRADDLTVGSPSAGRGRMEIEPLVGNFVNMLAVRVDLSGDPTFAEVVRRVGEEVRVAGEHGELPFDRVVDAVRPPRELSRPPLFQLSFGYLTEPVPLDLPGLSVVPEPVALDSARFDASWQLTQRADGLEVRVEYSTALFDEQSVDRFTEGFTRVLAQVCAAPSLRLSELRPVAPGERERLLALGAGPLRPVRETTMAAEFEARVAEAPEAPALVVAGRTLSYAELDRRADRLARHLVARGARPGTFVALAVPRSVEAVVASLAVLKSGAACLPLDPTHPPARLGRILDDAAAVVLVTDSATAGRLGSTVPAVLLDRDDIGTAPMPDTASLPDTAPLPGASPSDVAYVLYTSGSTGRPKGVQIEHRSVINFVDSVRDLFELTPADRVLGFAAMTYDVAMFETFAALLTGATLYHATDTERTSIHALRTLIETGGITVTDIPPTLMELMNPEEFPRLRIACVGGESSPAELVNRWNAGRTFLNVYGPTECTVWVTTQECAGRWEASPPIGLPMTNHVAHVLDPAGHPVPVGVPGELLIGGTGLARGYLNDPGLTDARFIPDPFGTAPGGRLYHTGDLVKRNPDGTLTFLGRIDHQIKIRGLRIELGDIETAARDHPGLAQIAVNPWTDDHGEHHLVAYLVPTDPATAPDRTALREHLATQLPPYMIPSHYVVLTGLPLNDGGKLDRRALPAPDPHTSDSTPTAPRTPTEHTLITDILSPLLHIPAINPHDDFFALGGNSLQATRLLSRIRDTFGVDVGLADFFAAPTPANLGAIIDAALADTLTDEDLLALIELLPPEEAERLLGGESGESGEADKVDEADEADEAAAR